ncbi:hypothetical protein [Gallaecimonas pentaromativorans]|uniref:Uncharacterized protein n=1 Tax=Gallaecimonas pentaromativorans TaxID=584787 RepID=A0A3N1PCZ4_9GAMM|nr:hypothetical protein [Gallaecimonas pentaromativorans]ROQ24887.1 hypothetical protein EDC28_106134 [Gallaecimonas pentaromativorans]
MKIILFFALLALFTLLLLYVSRDRQRPAANDEASVAVKRGALKAPPQHAAEAAALIMALAKTQDSWPQVLAQSRLFLWSSDEPEKAWNEQARREGLPPVALEGSGDNLFLVFGDHRQPLRVTGDRDDLLRGYLDLNLAVQPDYEVRYLIDSTHSSNRAFLALAHQDWQRLEQQFGAAAVAYRFYPLGANFETFISAVEAAYDGRYSH